MNAPHVDCLLYHLRPVERTKFQAPPAIDWSTDEFHLHLEDGVATVRLLKHYDTETAARSVVEPQLVDWEIASALDANDRVLHFQFHSSQIIDLDPSSANSVSVNIHLAGMTASVSFSSILPTYPPPPQGFTASTAVRNMWRRYEAYREGSESLTAMAYYCLTVFEQLPPAVGKKPRQVNGRAFNIDPIVLNRLGNLTTNYGDEDTARKSPSKRALTSEETNWVAATVRALIQRIGEVEANPTARLSQITMASLPPILPLN